MRLPGCLSMKNDEHSRCTEHGGHDGHGEGTIGKRRSLSGVEANKLT
jgi:hypothetical protein